MRTANTKYVRRAHVVAGAGLVCGVFFFLGFLSHKLDKNRRDLLGPMMSQATKPSIHGKRRGRHWCCFATSCSNEAESFRSSQRESRARGACGSRRVDLVAQERVGHSGARQRRVSSATLTFPPWSKMDYDERTFFRTARSKMCVDAAKRRPMMPKTSSYTVRFVGFPMV